MPQKKKDEEKKQDTPEEAEARQKRNHAARQALEKLVHQPSEWMQRKTKEGKTLHLKKSTFQFWCAEHGVQYAYLEEKNLKYQPHTIPCAVCGSAIYPMNAPFVQFQRQAIRDFGHLTREEHTQMMHDFQRGRMAPRG